MQKQRTPAAAKPVRKHREVEHQRRVCEDEATHVDGHVVLSSKGACQRAPPQALSAPILVTDAQEQRRAVDEIDDRGNLPNNADGVGKRYWFAERTFAKSVNLRVY